MILPCNFYWFRIDTNYMTEPWLAQAVMKSLTSVTRVAKQKQSLFLSYVFSHKFLYPWYYERTRKSCFPSLLQNPLVEVGVIVSSSVHILRSDIILKHVSSFPHYQKRWKCEFAVFPADNNFHLTNLIEHRSQIQITSIILQKELSLCN